MRTNATITVTSAKTAAIALATGHRMDRDEPRSTHVDVDCLSVAWPFDPASVTPLAWWRTMPADKLGEAEQGVIRATLGKLSVLKGREWLAAMRGDAAASVAIAVAMSPITTITLEVDLAMSVLMSNALAGNAAAALVLSHLLRQTKLDHPFARELAMSWLVFNLSRSLKPRAPCSPSPTFEFAS